MEPVNEVFEGKVPSFTEFVKENWNLPAGAAHDPNAPYNEKQPEEWSISGVEYDEKTGDLVIGINGRGYGNEVRIWTGDNVVIDAIDPTMTLGEDEFDAKLKEMLASWKSGETEIPDSIMQAVEGKLEIQEPQPPQPDFHDE